MKQKLLQYFLITLILVTNSCGVGYKEEYTNYTFVLKEVIPVTSPTSDTTPDYTFSSSEAGTISYGGSCSSNTTSAIAGNNKITLNTLSNGTYSNCKITVSHVISNTGDNLTSSLSMSSFTVNASDSTAPTNPSVSINSNADNTTSTSITLNISATDNVGVVGYYASENSTTPNGDSSGWVNITSTTSYSANVSFTLSDATNVSKTVYVWFKDSEGNISSGSNDSIAAVYNYWKLIAKQEDVSAAVFSSGATSSYLENENDDTSATYMIIGNITAGNYVDSLGFYKFHLVWGGLQVDSSGINKEVTWKQSSWLTNGTIYGFQEIGTSGFNDGTSGKDFLGLGDSSQNSYCVIDGDARTHQNWWNCVGVITRYQGDSIPGPLGKKASSMYLYVWSLYNL